MQPVNSSHSVPSDEQNCPNSACDPTGSYNPFFNRRTRKCDCKPSVTGARCDRCEADSISFGPNGCSKCYCMGVSGSCEEKRISRQTIGLSSPSLRDLNVTTIDDAEITEEDGHLKLGELDTENSISFLLYTQNPIKKKPTSILYWKLPEKFLGSRLSAYGGKLNYKIVFQHIKPDEQMSYSPDLVLVGANQEEVHYSHPEPLKSKTLTKLSIDLIEDRFTDAKGEPIRKDQLMNVLFDLGRILLKASYTKDIVFTGIKEIELISADQVESCRCPAGYLSGGSCDQCAPGYFRKPGSYYHQCIRCDCNGNSQKCDPITGKCIECEFNFHGDRCERCTEGYLLSRSRGFTECVLINETHVDYQENRICSDSTEGSDCTRCRAGYYNLVNGECTKCSCSGVTNKCKENYAYLNEIVTRSDSIVLKDQETGRQFTVNSSGSRFTFPSLPKDRTSIFWLLPDEFLGNKIKSYGYNLTYQSDIAPIDIDGSIQTSEPDVQIRSKTATIIYMSGETRADRMFNVPQSLRLRENVWERVDNVHRQVQKLSKLEFINILSDIQEIAIRAVYHDKQQSTSISNVRLTTVSDEPTHISRRKVQTNIERCLCPIGE